MTYPSETQTSASAFPEAPGREKGYDKASVDAFLTRARHAFEATSSDVTAADVREAAFPLVRHGYAIASVDAALGRIEDAFAARERASAVAAAGAHAWVGQVRGTAQVVLDRLSRPRGRRFDRVGGLAFGYRVDEVDRVADRISTYLETGQSLTVDQVRGVAFRMERRGYREAQVDAVLDAVVEVMLGVS